MEVTVTFYLKIPAEEVLGWEEDLGYPKDFWKKGVTISEDEGWEFLHWRNKGDLVELRAE